MPLAFVRWPFNKTLHPLNVTETVWDCDQPADKLGLYRQTFRSGEKDSVAHDTASGHLDNLYLHVLSFSLQLVGLTHRSFPVPITRSLQTYTSFRLHQAIAAGQALRFVARTGEALRRDKGTEFTFHTQAFLRHAVEGTAPGMPVWERTNHFYARGLRYAHSQDGETPNCTLPADAPLLASWVLSDSARLDNARFLGDFNPMHLNAGMARLMGSPRPSAHPPRAVRACLAHLPGYRGDVPHRVEVWMKGPLFYRSKVSLRALVERPDAPQLGAVLGLFLEGESRPALVIRLSA